MDKITPSEIERELKSYFIDNYLYLSQLQFGIIATTLCSYINDQKMYPLTPTGLRAYLNYFGYESDGNYMCSRVCSRYFDYICKILFSPKIINKEKEEYNSIYISKDLFAFPKARNTKKIFIDDFQKWSNLNRYKYIGTNPRTITSETVLVKHPFLPKTYMDLSISESEIFHVKMQCLSNIVGCLGAKSAEGHAVFVEEEKRTKDANGNMTFSPVEISGTYNSTEAQKLKNGYSIRDTFSGRLTKRSWKQAKEEAEKYGLDQDFDILNLIDQRDPSRDNKITSRKVSIELSRELNQTIDLAFELKIKGFDLKGHYNSALETRKKVRFDLDIQF